jgi:hypothetical protein
MTVLVAVFSNSGAVFLLMTFTTAQLDGIELLSLHLFLEWGIGWLESQFSMFYN